MVCKNCGAEIAQGTTFCPECVKAVQSNNGAQSYGQNPYGSQSQFGGHNYYGQQMAYGNAIPADMPAGFANIIKGLRSSLFIAAVVAFTASLVFTLVNTLMGYSAYSSAYYNMLNGIGRVTGDYSALNELYSYGFTYNVGGVIGGLIGMMPSIIICAGLWMLFAEGRKNYSPIKNTGIVLIKVLTIVRMIMALVVLAICMLVCILCIIVGVGASSSNYFTDSGATSSILIGVAVVLMFVIVVAGALGVFYYLQLLKTLTGIEMQMATGRPADKISGFVIVMMFIGGVFTALASLVSLFSGSVLAGFGGICSAVSSIFFCMILLNLKNDNASNMFSQGFANQTQPNSYQQMPGTYNNNQNLF